MSLPIRPAGRPTAQLDVRARGAMR
jgi:hypothetical protein